MFCSTAKAYSGRYAMQCEDSPRYKYGPGVLSIKDGTYYCYCAYVLRISRYLGFLWVVPTNTRIFLRILKLCGESRTKQVLLVSEKKIGGNHAFFRDSLSFNLGKNAIHCFVFWRFLEISWLNYL